MHLCELRRVPEYARPYINDDGKMVLKESEVAYEYIRFLQKESGVNYGEYYIPEETLLDHFWHLYVTTTDDED